MDNRVELSNNGNFHTPIDIDRQLSNVPTQNTIQNKPQMQLTNQKVSKFEQIESYVIY